MITGRITNSRFRTRIQEALARARSESRAYVHIEGLAADEVNIQPGQYIGNFIGFAAPWIELDSPDPLLAHVSKQVLDLELAYGAFCGLGHVVIAGPKYRPNVAEYAQAISGALSHSTYMQLLVQLSIDDWIGDEDSIAQNADYDPLSAWDAWNTLRTVCKYSNLLALGTLAYIPSSSAEAGCRR
jgi:protein arginine N-methyltransferase 5